MADPWASLGLRKFSEGRPVWLSYAETLRKPATDAQRLRARDAFEAIEFGQWGRFANSVERDFPDQPLPDAPRYDGPLADRLAMFDQTLAQRPIDRNATCDQITLIFDDLAMQTADTYLRVEPAMATMLEQHRPHSEPFILFALDKFHHLTEQAVNHPVIARLLDLADELTLVETLENGQSTLSSNLRPLAKPASSARRWWWAVGGERREIAALYAYAGWRNPRFRRRLDPGEWAWWSNELARDRLSLATMLGSLVAAIIIGLATLNRHMRMDVVVGSGVATFAFLLIDRVVARAFVRRRLPRPFDGPLAIPIACAALLLPAFTRFLPPDPAAAAMVAGLALIIAWALRLLIGLSGGTRSGGWLDSTGVPALILLGLSLSLSIPWERFAMLASYAWLLHAVLPQLRRAIAMALDRIAELPWGYALGAAGATIALAAPFAPALGLNLESTRVALLVTGYGLLCLSIYPRRALPESASWTGCVLIGLYLLSYTQGGGEYRPGPAPSAGETLLTAERGDVVEWNAFSVNGDDILARMKRDNPPAYERLMPILRKASCEFGRECAANPIDIALKNELNLLLPTIANRHLADWTRLELRVRESQYRRGYNTCGMPYLIVTAIDPIDQRRDYASLILRIVSAGPRPPGERPSIALPDGVAIKRYREEARDSVMSLKGGPAAPGARQRCIEQLVRVRMLSRLNDDVIATIARKGYDLSAR